MPDLERPTVPFLYKYGSAAHLEWLQPILLNHQLYFPSPAQLNDPKDARPKLIVTDKQECLRRIVNPFLAVNARLPLDRLAMDVRFMIDMVDRRDLEQLAEWVTPSFHRAMEKHRIYSMSTRADNKHLWTDYAADHTGYCLEFVNGGDPFRFARTVIYGDEIEIDFCNRDSIDSALLFKKIRTYEPEEEVRILLFPRGQPHEVAFDPTLLRRVILGRRMTEQHQSIIRAWCLARVPALPAVDEIEANEAVPV
jgi:hypothetical protein